MSDYLAMCLIASSGALAILMLFAYGYETDAILLFTVWMA